MIEGRFKSLSTRVAVAAIAIPVIVFLTMQGGYPFLGLVALLSSLSLTEFYRMAERKGAHPLTVFGVVAGLFVTLAFGYERLQLDLYQWFLQRGIRLSMFSQLQYLLVVILVSVLLALLIELFRSKGSPLLNLSATMLGLLAISLFFGTLVSLRELFPFGFPVHKFFEVGGSSAVQLNQIDRWGGYTVVSLFAAIWVCDTAAYFGGIWLGKHKLFERVSPNKTWEGAIFGFAFAIATMIAAQRAVLPYLGMRHAIVIGLLVGVFGQLGDLVESRFKRDAGLKDSSAIIPGHGGVYDRFDSLVFLSPIVYLYIDFVVLS